MAFVPVKTKGLSQNDFIVLRALCFLFQGRGKIKNYELDFGLMGVMLVVGDNRLGALITEIDDIFSITAVLEKRTKKQLAKN